jgi:hypothetical protein
MLKGIYIGLRISTILQLASHYTVRAPKYLITYSFSRPLAGKPSVVVAIYVIFGKPLFNNVSQYVHPKSQCPQYIPAGTVLAVSMGLVGKALQSVLQRENRNPEREYGRLNGIVISSNAMHI